MYAYDDADKNDIKDIKNFTSINSSFNSLKREKFTEDFENDMWRFLVRKLRDPSYAPARKPNGLLLWRDYIAETKCVRSAMNLATHFRKSMRANIMYSELSNEDITFIYNELKWTLGQREEDLFEQRKHHFPLPDPRTLKKRKILVSENDESGYVMTSDDQMKNGMKKMRPSKKNILNDQKNNSNMPRLISQDNSDMPRRSKLEDAIGKLREKAGLKNKTNNITECASDDLEESEISQLNHVNTNQFNIQKEFSTSSVDLLIKKKKRRGRPKKGNENNLIEDLVKQTSSNLDTSGLNSSLLPPICSVQFGSPVNDFNTKTPTENDMNDLTINFIKSIYQHVNGDDTELTDDVIQNVKILKGFKDFNQIVNNCVDFFKSQKSVLNDENSTNNNNNVIDDVNNITDNDEVSVSNSINRPTNITEGGYDDYCQASVEETSEINLEVDERHSTNTVVPDIEPDSLEKPIEDDEDKEPNNTKNQEIPSCDINFPSQVMSLPYV